jgi:hypothetical protein
MTGGTRVHTISKRPVGAGAGEAACSVRADRLCQAVVGPTGRAFVHNGAGSCRASESRQAVSIVADVTRSTTMLKMPVLTVVGVFLQLSENPSLAQCLVHAVVEQLESIVTSTNGDHTGGNLEGCTCSFTGDNGTATCQ